MRSLVHIGEVHLRQEEAQILRDLGVASIKLLASSERTYVGLSGFGIEIASTESLGG